MKNLILLIALAACSCSLFSQPIAKELEAPFNLEDSTSQFLNTSIRYDYNNDGTPERVDYKEYYANGLEYKSSIDDNNDGVMDEDEYTYRNSHEDIVSIQWDYNSDDVIDEVINYAYDANFKLITISTDYDNDGVMDEISAFTYNSDNSLNSESYDGNADGVIEDVKYYFYNSNGMLEEEQRDAGANGSIELRQFYEYDVNDNIVKISTSLDGDLIIDRLIEMTYNGNNQLVSRTRDYGNDGIVNELLLNTYNNGVCTVSSFDHNADGIYDEFKYFDYNTLGIRNLVESDTDADGLIDNRSFTTFDSDGNILAISEDINGDDIYDSNTFYDYSYLKNCTSLPGIANKLYLVEIPYAGDWVISTCGNETNFDTKLSVGTSACFLDIAENDDFCGDKSEIEITINSPQFIYVNISGENNEIGNFELAVYDKNAVGIREIEQISLEVYPNPASATLNFNNSELDGERYTIYNALGAKSLEGQFNYSSGIDIRELEAGMYFLSVQNGNTLFNANFIKK